MPRVLFLHGLESSPNGTKARWLAQHYDSYTPSLTTGDWPLALGEAREAIHQFHPDVVVGSSFGGALLLALITEKSWRGPSVMIAQAGVKFGVADTLPVGMRVVLLHGTEDTVVPMEGSLMLAETGGPGVEMWIQEGGDHRLERCLSDGTLARAIARVSERI